MLPQGDIPMSGQGEGAFGAKGGPCFRGEKPKGIFSFEKRMSPPAPPKEKRGGISISPRTPLKRHKGAGCGPPLWKPLPGQDGGAAAEREVGGVLFAAPVCGVPTGAGTQCRTEQV